MGKFVDLTGKIFNNQKVLKRVGVHPISGTSIWEVLCLACDKLFESRSDSIQFQNTSCGCQSKNITHGLTKKETKKFYNTWKKMNERCYDPQDQRYSSYGGRGIYMVDEWLGPEGRIAFVAWAVATCKDQSLSIDRINNDGPYAPWNCRWEDPFGQAGNRRTNIMVEVPEFPYPICLKAATRLPYVKAKYETVRSRVVSGWDTMEALTTPPLRVRNTKHKRVS